MNILNAATHPHHMMLQLSELSCFLIARFINGFKRSSCFCRAVLSVFIYWEKKGNFKATCFSLPTLVLNTLCSGCHGDGSHIPRMGSKMMQWAGCWDGVLRPFAHTVWKTNFVEFIFQGFLKEDYSMFPSFGWFYFIFCLMVYIHLSL